jgi:hypothetical protein
LTVGLGEDLIGDLGPAEQFATLVVARPVLEERPELPRHVLRRAHQTKPVAQSRWFFTFRWVMEMLRPDALLTAAEPA